MLLTVMLSKIIMPAAQGMKPVQIKMMKYKRQRLTRSILKTEHSLDAVLICMKFLELVKAAGGDKLPFFVML